MFPRFLLLFHNDNVSGFVVRQLVVPQCKRIKIMQVAHDHAMSGHFGVEKTLSRISSSFYWPSIRQDVINYVSACDICQHRKLVTKYDRVPIVPITRPDVPFETAGRFFWSDRHCFLEGP